MRGSATDRVDGKVRHGGGPAKGDREAAIDARDDGTSVRDGTINHVNGDLTELWRKRINNAVQRRRE